MVDLICKRYPGIKPSEYLEIRSKELAFQVDSSMALKSYLIESDISNEKMEGIYQKLDNVCRAMGAKIKGKRYFKKLYKEEEELPKVEDALKALGGKGVVFEGIKKL